MSIQVTLIVPIKGKEDAYMYRECDLPIPPFIGLTIGSLAVTNVWVCPGWDGSDISVGTEPVEEGVATAWCKFGPWKMEESE